MAKDRARPFSRKHRRYWLPVTGGMILIGLVNVAIGLWSYHAPSEFHEAIQIVHDAGDTLGPSELPAAVMRAFAIKYPRILPAGARALPDGYVVMFPRGAAHHSATFGPDGTFVSEQ
ncbi:MAG TPA: hypothetical protein VLX92_18875 [Kofleriaceae bacterium]|nr:hypothetical protein [Kofleriaceae bacterium]